MSQLFYPAMVRATDDLGVPLSNAQWFFYLTGTTDEAVVFQDLEREVPFAQPVVSDSVGKFPQIFLDPAVTYRADLWDADMAINYSQIDPANVPDPASVAAASSAQTALTAADLATDAASQATDAIAAVSGQVTGESAITFSLGGLMGDDEFADHTVWTPAAGWTFADNTDSFVTATMSANAALKSVEGDGTTTQPVSATFRNSAHMTRIRASRWIYSVCDVGYPAGFSGRARLRILFYQRDQVTQTGSTIFVSGTDYLSVAAASSAVEVLQLYAKAPADAYYACIAYAVERPTAINAAGFAYFARTRMEYARQSDHGVLSLGVAKTYVIASGAITIDGSSSNIVVDTEAAAATDDLDTINGGEDGWIIQLRGANSGRDVTIKDGAGINLPADVTLTASADRLWLSYQSGVWFGVAPLSDNT